MLSENRAPAGGAPSVPGACVGAAVGAAAGPGPATAGGGGVCALTTASDATSREADSATDTRPDIRPPGHGTGQIGDEAGLSRGIRRLIIDYRLDNQAVSCPLLWRH